MAAVRHITQGPLAAQVEAIDRTGYYPCAELQQLAAVGAMSAHLDSTAGPADYGLAIRAMAEASRHTGFRPWYFLLRHGLFVVVGLAVLLVVGLVVLLVVLLAAAMRLTFEPQVTGITVQYRGHVLVIGF